MLDLLRGNIEYENWIATNFVLLEEEDIKFVLEMRNHEGIRRWMKNSSLISYSNHLDFIERLKNSHIDFYWLVTDKTSGDKIGVIYINSLNEKDQKCEFGIYANPFNQEKGRGTILANIELYAIFEVAGLFETTLEVDPDNEKASVLYKKLGFKEVNFTGAGYLKMVLKKSNYRGNKK
jgi:UDP-4-amino-4,6-dideoxy-N-acetyl-beta-L-altrosamine N-acetyltransferase